MTKKRVALTIKFLVSGSLIWYLLGGQWDEVESNLVRVAPEALAAAFAIMVLQIVICAFRWRAVLKAIDADMGFVESFRLFYIGSFFNQALPSAVGGDAVRIYMSYKSGLTVGQAVNSVLLERVATVAALVLLVLGTQPFFLPRVSEEAGAMILPAVSLLAVGAVLGVGVLAMLDRLPESLRKWRIVRGIAGLAEDTRRVFLAPKPALSVMAIALVGHMNVTFAVYVIAMGLGLEVDFIDCLALFPPVMLIMTLPISIGGWGVREGAMQFGFGLIGVAEGGALALSLLFGFVGIASNLPGGVVWLTSGQKAKPGDLPPVPVEPEPGNSV